MDDMVTNSVKEIDHVRDLDETFKVFKHYGIKLNPRRCIFRVRSRKFLSYMIDPRGIKVNPNKIKVMLNIKSLIMVKEVQKLTGCIATFRRHDVKISG